MDRRAQPERFTPAYAGKGVVGRLLLFSTAVHTRGCGEGLRDANGGKGIYGSPPHVRGRGQADHRHLLDLRFTPVYPGKGGTLAFWLSRFAVHPACVGKGRSTRSPASPTSVNPRIRGEGGQLRQPPPDPLRLTPTLAGKGYWPSASATRPTVHPSPCGEVHHHPPGRRSQSGSAPHVRG